MLRTPLLVIDLETTGVDPTTDSILQIGGSLLAPDTLNEEASFETLVRPSSPISVESWRIHGLTADRLESAPPLLAAVAEFEAFAPQDVLLGGHNVAFDVAFLKAAYADQGLDYRFDYHTIDVWSIAFFVLGARGVGSGELSLDSLSELFGISRSHNHDALEDARLTAEILRRLLRVVRSDQFLRVES